MTDAYVDECLKRYIRRGVLLDTNVLLLLLFGLTHPGDLDRFKRTQGYSRSDHRLLRDFVKNFRVRVTTPHVLTEVSNLAKNLPERWKPRFHKAFTTYVKSALEESQASKDVVATDVCRRFGLTDGVILSQAVGRYLLLTDDFGLAQYFNHCGGHSLNFNHSRALKFGL